MSYAAEHREVLPGISICPQVAETPAGAVEFDFTEGRGPVVMSLHGGLGGCDQGRVLSMWIDTRRYRILSPSRPGYLGTPLEVGRTAEQQADAMASLLDALGLDRVSVMGASAGGPPAYLFAIRHPDRVWGLIVIDGISGHYDLPEAAGPITQAMFLSEPGQEIIRKIGKFRPGMMLQCLLRAEACFTKDQMKKHLDHVVGNERSLSFISAFLATMTAYKHRKPGTMNDVEQFRRYSHLPVERIGCPSLIVHGTHDADVKFYDGVYAYEHIEGAERFWIEEGTHLGFWISPNGEKARHAARHFLEKHRPD